MGRGGGDCVVRKDDSSSLGAYDRKTKPSFVSPTTGSLEKLPVANVWKYSHRS